jgi:hypothetical protein
MRRVKNPGLVGVEPAGKPEETKLSVQPVSAAGGGQVYHDNVLLAPEDEQAIEQAVKEQNQNVARATIAGGITHNTVWDAFKLAPESTLVALHPNTAFDMHKMGIGHRRNRIIYFADAIFVKNDKVRMDTMLFITPEPFSVVRVDFE